MSGGRRRSITPPRSARELGGAQIYLKREDLAHTGAHKINNALGQGLLAQRMGKRRIIAETGAGQHGVATATVCALLGLECVVYMGEVDIARQSLNVFRMKLLGAEVRAGHAGTRTLQGRHQRGDPRLGHERRDTYYLIGSVVGPHPYPRSCATSRRVIGREARAQMLASEGPAARYAGRLRRRRLATRSASSIRSSTTPRCA